MFEGVKDGDELLLTVVGEYIESPQGKIVPNFETIALGKLSDDELDLLEEGAKLHESGHSEEAIATMMGSEKWQQYLKSETHFKEEYEKAKECKIPSKAI